MEARQILPCWQNLFTSVTDVSTDISTKNIAFTVTHALRLCQEDFLKMVGTPNTRVLTRLDGKPLRRGLPNQLVEAAEWLEWADEDEEDIRLIDFGSGFLCQGPPPEKLCQPVEFRAPEALMGRQLDWKVDLWSVGIMVSGSCPKNIHLDVNSCQVYFLVFGCLPFYHVGGYASFVAQMINFVEDLPPEWRSDWDRLRSGENGSLKIRERKHSFIFLNLLRWFA
jgi:serine/threonine-protein kinase SRPK3